MPNFRKLTDSFGLETFDVDLATAPRQTGFSAVEQALYCGQVLVCRDQQLSPAQFVAFARKFGRPEPHVIDQFHHPEFPEILILSNVMKDGKPTGLSDGGTYWHTDYSYLAEPAKATTLYALEMPRSGGDTRLANMRAAYDDLPQAMRARIDAMITLNVYGNRDDRDPASRTSAENLSAAQRAKVPPVRHPLVRPHPVTGQKALYSVSGTSIGIEGMPEDEALALLRELAAHATQPKYQLAVKYNAGDVVIWDNPSLLHCAPLPDPAHARTLHRITVK
jgi:taurine dioxygenase